MKLRTQILAIGLTGAFVAALVGGVGLLSTNRLAGAFDGSARMGLAAQNSQGAAMMLGAIRGDVQRAMLGSIGRDKKQIADAQKALDEHSKALASALDSLVQSPLSAQTKATINDTVPVARAYTKAAANLLNLAATDTAAAAAVPEFQRLFNELEKQMATQVDAIRKDGSAFSESSALVVKQARYAVGAALLLATGLVVLAALWLSTSMSRPMAYAVKVARSLAQGDLSAPVSVGGNDETAQLLQAMADMQSSLGQIVFSVKTNAGRVAVASAEIAHGNMDLSARTERQAGSLEETAAAMEELSAAVNKNAQSALQANRLATHASVTAMKAGEVVERVAETMHVIQESSKKISAIVSLVDGIAAQTNILALNAGVEAARAAEFGKGFAVVASEVRSLAGRAADAAKQISALIRASSERIESGGELVGQTVEAMREVVTSSRRVTEIMGEISAASSEQSAGVAEVGKAVADMDEVTQRNSALVEQMAAATNDLKTQANQLVEVVAVFRLGATCASA